MKTMIILTTAILSFYGCTKTKEQQAQQKIKDYVKANINDPSSYENIEYGKLTPFKRRIASDEVIATHCADSIMLFADIEANAISKEEADKRTLKLDEERASIYSQYENEYVMFDKCRSKNTLGVPVIHSIIYTFDTLLNITKAEQEK